MIGSGAAALLLPHTAIASPPRGTAAQHLARGWNTLLLGAGGLVTGIDIAPDGAMVCRCDTYGAYRWSGTTETISNPNDKWIPLISASSLRGFTSRQPAFVSFGAYELVIAPTRTTRLFMITQDVSARSTAGTNSLFGVYMSNDSGAHWIEVNDKIKFPTFRNADSNGKQRVYSGKIVVDPNNPDVVYVGMPYNSGNAHAVYRSIDGGITWDGAFCLGVISSPAADAGVTGMCFDKKHGTIVVDGQIRTKRLLIPVAGIGVYETLDGGATFFLTSGGPKSTFYSQGMDHNGVYYVGDSALAGKLWRYSGPAGAWADLTSQPNSPQRTISSFAVDPRQSAVGTLYFSRGGDPYHGWKSVNANATDPAKVTWGKGGGNATGIPKAPSYDVEWLNHARVAGIAMAFMRCDQNGTVWWGAAQGLWCNSPIDYPHPVTANSVSRGIEETVAQDVCCPPGAPAPLMGAQDVGILTGGLTKYPTRSYNPIARMDCTSLEWSASDPSFMVAKVDVEYSTGNSGGGYSGYSRNFGETWVPYATQPVTLYGNAGTCGGQIVAIDRDHHICVPFASSLQPCCTSTATDPRSVSWKLCSGLPISTYGVTGGFRSRSKPLAVDRVDIGTAYAYDHLTGYIYRSNDYGATWRQVSQQKIAVIGDVYLLSVPGYAGHLWLTGRFNGGSPSLFRSIDHGSHWTNAGITIPDGGHPIRFTLGAPQTPGGYPTLFMVVNRGYWTRFNFYRSTDQGATWALFGTMPTDMPLISQLDYCNCIGGDWNRFGVLYCGSGGSGFFYYGG